MNDRHRVLIIEDDDATAEGLTEIVDAAGCESLVTDNKNDALSLMRERLFCLVLLDLEIKGDSQAIKGHTAHGISLLRDIRKLNGKHTGICWWLPVLVVSGFARERDEAVQIMRDGATNIIQKPFKTRQVADAIRAELVRCGRHTHGHCLQTPSATPPAAEMGWVVAIPGDRHRRRTRVVVAQTSLWLPDSDLKVLLQLIAAHQQGTGVHKRTLGAMDDQGFKGISRLREALRPALGEGDGIIENDRHGTYSLARGVLVTECNAETLAGIGDRTITSLARAIAQAIAKQQSIV